MLNWRHWRHRGRDVAGAATFLARLINGRPYRMLTVIDAFAREALAVVAKPKTGSAEVLEALYPLILKPGHPTFIRSDNGKEFIVAARQSWLRKVGVKPVQIYPASPR